MAALPAIRFTPPHLRWLRGIATLPCWQAGIRVAGPDWSEVKRQGRNGCKNKISSLA